MRASPSPATTDPSPSPGLCRIVIVGTMGAGKTTLAKRIASILGIPHVETDQYLWRANWTFAPTEEFRADVERALSGDAWVACGNHPQVRDIMWGRADTLIWLDYSAPLIVFRLLRRTFRHILLRTERYAPGNRDRLGTVIQRDDPLFVWHGNRHKRTEYPQLLSTPEYAHLRVIRLTSPRATRRWLRRPGAARNGHFPGLSMAPAVVHIADYGGPYSGNFIASLQVLGRQLNDIGLRQALVLPGRAQPQRWLPGLIAGDSPVYLLPEESGFLRASLRIWRILDRENARIAHVHFARYDLQTWCAAVMQRLRGKRLDVIWHEHGGTLPPARTIQRRVKDFIKLGIMGRRATLVSVSPALRDDLVERGMPAGRAYVLPNGIDLNRATAASKGRAEVRAAYNLPDDATVLLCFGWDPYRKGVDLAIGAAQRLAQDYSQVILLLVGKPEMVAFVRDHLGNDQPPWLRIAPPAEQVGDLYAMADAFLSPSREEGMPYSVAEAMASGLPVLLSDIAGHVPFSAAPGTLAFSIGSVDGPESALRRFLDWSPEERRRRGEANRTFAVERFSLTAWERGMRQIYRRLVSTPDQ